MKRISGKVALIVLLLILLVASNNVNAAGSQQNKGPAPKAVGTVAMYNDAFFCLDNVWYMDFNAHQEWGNRPAKGDAFGWCEAGMFAGFYWKVDIEWVKVTREQGKNVAYFAGPIVDSNYMPVGLYVGFKVKDGGTPGRNGDVVWNVGFENEAQYEAFKAGAYALLHADPWWVFQGNLQVMN
jgi:hypothetical protein